MRESIGPTLPMTNPYQGLNAFTAETRQFFFGRDREIQALMRALQGCEFVPVIGGFGVAGIRADRSGN